MGKFFFNLAHKADTYMPSYSYFYSCSCCYSLMGVKGSTAAPISFPSYFFASPTPMRFVLALSPMTHVVCLCVVLWQKTTTTISYQKTSGNIISVLKAKVEGPVMFRDPHDKALYIIASGWVRGGLTLNTHSMRDMHSIDAFFFSSSSFHR
jgi:hypothetical protein